MPTFTVLIIPIEVLYLTGFKTHFFPKNAMKNLYASSKLKVQVYG